MNTTENRLLRPATGVLRKPVYKGTSTRPRGPATTQEPVPSTVTQRNVKVTVGNGSSACPGSVSPHALRRGYVTAARNAGQPKDVTGERVNMSGKVLDKHYDKGSFDEKAERRRSHLKDI